MNEALRRLLVAAEGAGELEGPDVGRGHAEHPVCGDEVLLTARVADGRIVRLAWRASGCPATLAVAAAAHLALQGAPVAEAAARLREHLARLGGLAPHEGHAERIVLQALADALVPG